jgi:hypothetical protein
MQLSDSTNKNGLIQECEFWTKLGDGAISGNALLLKQFVNRLNRSYDRLMPLLLSRGDTMRWDDTVNHTKHPVATFNITSGTGDYQFLSDEQGNSILNIVALHILPSSSSTEYQELRTLTLDDPRANRAMYPNPSAVGVPSAYVERNSTIFFDVVPNYSATAGGKLFFERSPSYFSASTLTQTPGIPEAFHPLLALYAALDWNIVNIPTNQVLIVQLQREIERQRIDLDVLINKKNPTRRRVVGVRTTAI